MPLRSYLRRWPGPLWHRRLIDNFFRLAGISERTEISHGRRHIADRCHAAMLYYDHLITFGEEYRHIWRNPRSGASVLFLINRYFAFFVVSALLPCAALRISMDVAMVRRA